MPKYVYPALVQKDPECGYTVEFPDWKEQFGGMTHGRDWDEAMYMGDDLLNLMCMCTEDDKKEFPVRSMDLTEQPGQYLTLFCADTNYYRKLCAYNKKRRLRWRMEIRAQKKRRKYPCPIKG